MPKPIVRTQAEVRASSSRLNVCRVCGNDIHVMCRTATGICSENCEKKATANASA